MIHLNGSGVPTGDSRYGSRKNACDHPESKVTWSGQWLPVGVGRPLSMKGKCSCGQTVSQSHDDPHGKPPYDNPYWTGPDGVRKPLGNDTNGCAFCGHSKAKHSNGACVSCDRPSYGCGGFDQDPEYLKARKAKSLSPGQDPDGHWMTKLTNAAPMQAMTLLIRGDLQDLTIPVADVDDASRKYREYVEREDLGSSEVAFGKVVMGGKLVATIKYNGRIQLENAIKVEPRK